MKIDKYSRRLKAIKEIHPRVFTARCSLCREQFIREKMFKVERWHVNRDTRTLYFCKKCMPTKEKVLEYIDDKRNIFGIAYVDEFPRNLKG